MAVTGPKSRACSGLTQLCVALLVKGLSEMQSSRQKTGGTVPSTPFAMD